MIKSITLLAALGFAATTTEVGSFNNKASPYYLVNSPGYGVVNLQYDVDADYVFIWDQGPVSG